MQLCNATVHLAGDRNFAIPKRDISVAEVVFLRRIHGQDAVVDIAPTRKTTDSLRVTRDRLLAAYGDRKEHVALIDAMFQNLAVQGLTKLSDLRLDEMPGAAKTGASAALSAADLPDEPTDADDE